MLSGLFFLKNMVASGNFGGMDGVDDVASSPNCLGLMVQFNVCASFLGHPNYRFYGLSYNIIKLKYKAQASFVSRPTYLLLVGKPNSYWFLFN